MTHGQKFGAKLLSIDYFRHHERHHESYLVGEQTLRVLRHAKSEVLQYNTVFVWGVFSCQVVDLLSLVMVSLLLDKHKPKSTTQVHFHK